MAVSLVVQPNGIALFLHEEPACLSLLVVIRCRINYPLPRGDIHDQAK